MESAAGRSAHQEAVEAWRSWRKARRQRDRDKAAFELWQLCEYVVWGAASELAEKFGGGRHVTVPEWRLRNGLSEEDIRYAAFPAVMEAAKGFDPDKGVRFQTYAYKFILGHLRGLVTTEDALSVAGEWQDIDIEEEQPGGAQRRDLWYLLELDSCLDGPGKGGELARYLERLSPVELRQVQQWLEENRARAIKHYGESRFGFLHFYAGFAAMVDEMPLEAQKQNLFDDMSRVGPIQGVAIRADGEKWDHMLPVQADILLRSGLKPSAVARQLGQPWSTFKDMRGRMKDLGFTSSRFTADQVDAAVRGKKRGRPPKN
jgi:hypothetical protein